MARSQGREGRVRTSLFLQQHRQQTDSAASWDLPTARPWGTLVQPSATLSPHTVSVRFCPHGEETPWGVGPCHSACRDSLRSRRLSLATLASGDCPFGTEGHQVAVGRAGLQIHRAQGTTVILSSDRLDNAGQGTSREAYLQRLL